MKQKSARWHLLLRLVVGAVGLCLWTSSALAQAEHFTVNPATEVPLKLGWNEVDLQFNGTKYHILGQHNDIGTVHNTMTYTFVDPGFNSVFFEPGRFPEDLGRIGQINDLYRMCLREVGGWGAAVIGEQ
jgi:hypothetical protein